MESDTDFTLKPVLWVGSSKRDLMDLPQEVRTNFGYGLYQAQEGQHPDIAKPFKGFGSAQVLELVEDHRGDTFRAVYTVKFVNAIVVLHVFKKKSKKGISTPKPDVDLIHERLKRAEELYRQWELKRRKNL